MTVTEPTAPPARRHVGAATERIEDARLLVGRGRFMDDLEPLPGTLEAADRTQPSPPRPDHRLRRRAGAPVTRRPVRDRPEGNAADAGVPAHRANADALPPGRHRSCALRGRAGGGGRGDEPAPGRGRGRAGRGRPTRRCPPWSTCARRLSDDTPILHEEAGTNVATDRTHAFRRRGGRVRPRRRTPCAAASASPGTPRRRSRPMAWSRTGSRTAPATGSPRGATSTGHSRCSR